MEEALVDFLLAQSALTSLVSTRIDWTKRAQAKALPAVVLTKIDALPDYHMAGPSGLVSARVQVDCFGSTYASAKAVARAVATAISGLDEEISDGNSPATITVLRGGFISGEREFPELGQGSADLSRISIDFIIWHGLG